MSAEALRWISRYSLATPRIVSFLWTSCNPPRYLGAACGWRRNEADSGKLALFHDHWSRKVVGKLNGQHLHLIEFSGEFVWHEHDHEDELFLVVKGRFRMEYRDRPVWLEEGEFLIVPRGDRTPTSRRSGGSCAAVRACRDYQHGRCAG
jgi:Cupin domain